MNPIEYIKRTRDYYRAQGFTSDYAWATNTDIPFTRLAKPLQAATVTVVTTAVVEADIPKPSRSSNSYSFEEVPDQFATDELSWDKTTTNTDDRQSYFPLEVLKSMAETGAIGKLARRFHFIPTEYSQRNTLEKDAPLIVRHCLEDEVDIALLIPI